MADYHSILNKTISGLPNNNAQTRNLVYQRARTAIDKQLRAITPPPSEEAIARQMASLEEAIKRIEAENTSPQMAGPAQPASSPSPVPTAPVAPPAAAPPQQPTAAPRAPGAPAPAPQAPEFSVAGERGPDPGARPPAYDSSLDDLADSERPVKVGRSRGSALPGDNTAGKRRSGFATALIVLIVIALIGGGGYALWLNKEPLMAALGLDGQTEPAQTAVQQEDAPEEESADTSAAAGEEEASKEEARLGSDGSTVAPAPRDVTSNAREPAGQVPAQPGAGTTGEDNAPSVALPGAEPIPGSDQSEDQQVNPVNDGSSQAGQSGLPSAPALSSQLGQRAYLYEEGVASAPASRDDGEMVWSLDEEAPEEGQPREPVIKGRLDIPNRGLTMDMLIRRNTDESLSASHLIELVFKTPSDFTGGSIDTIARFVLKPSEQARGEPLIAVPVKISAGYFMIALNNLEQARDANEKLMLDADWIDIPVSYSTGRRALVTLSKGDSGEEVFTQAFEDWKNR